MDNVFGYPPAVWARFVAPRFLGSLDKTRTHSTLHRLAGGHGELELAIVVRDDIIIEARARVLGCPVLIACADWLAERLDHAPVSRLQAEEGAEAKRLLEIPPEKAHCALLIEDAAIALRHAVLGNTP